MRHDRSHNLAETIPRILARKVSLSFDTRGRRRVFSRSKKTFLVENAGPRLKVVQLSICRSSRTALTGHGCAMSIYAVVVERTRRLSSALWHSLAPLSLREYCVCVRLESRLRPGTRNRIGHGPRPANRRCVQGITVNCDR